MFVQALAEFADRELSAELSEESREEKPVPYFIEIGPDGSFLNVTHRMATAVRGKKTVAVPMTLSVPRTPVNRNSGLYPLLAADDVKYVLGVGPWTNEGDEQNHRERHEAFVRLLGEAAKATGDAALGACDAFYRREGQVENARVALKDIRPGSIVALSVAGAVTNAPTARRYWRGHYDRAKNERMEKGGLGECIVSGRYGPIAPTHEKIKGLAGLGGQAAGVSLMSFDKKAFRTYGWDQNANSPVSPDRAMAYVLALNAMLKPGSKYRRDVAKVAFVFWTRTGANVDPILTLDYPDESEIKALLELDPRAEPKQDQFYLAGLGANGGRLIVRYWVTETLPQLIVNLRGWFEGLRVADAYGDRLAPEPRLWQLRNAIHREGEPPSSQVLALIRRAIEGRERPLGGEILAAALRRWRLGKGWDERKNAARMGLIRLCVNDFGRLSGEEHMTPELDDGQRHKAYLCGRLLAVYESLQYQAHGKEVGQTITDRYYGLASTFPELAFPKIQVLGFKHLRTLRGEKGGARVRLQAEITRLHDLIGENSEYHFPAALDLASQGRFALGYYHQRAHQFAQAKSAKDKDKENQDQ